VRPNGIYHFNPGDGSFNLIGPVTEGPTWIWIDVDPRGTTGGNQVYVTWFGSHEKYYRFDPAARTFTLLHAANYQRETRADQVAAGHYPWLVAAGAGAVWTAGTGTFGVQRMRLALPNDPPSLSFQQQDEWYYGVRVWRKGGGVADPWGSVPGFTLSHGPHGWHYLGSTSAEDLAALTDADLNAALSAGLGTGIPRQFSVTELAQLREFVRSNSPWAIRGLPPPGEPPPPPPPPPPACGDGKVDPGEECDDGNLVPCDGCNDVCQVEACGNGRVECAEECDDGNVQGGDGCSAICEIEPPPPPPPGDIPVPRTTLEAWLAELETIVAAIKQLLGIP
jgi:cysteine-rich repeat protein